MRHASRDYDRIQDPAGLIPADEPVFLLRGKDRAAPGTVRFWADAALALGADGELTSLAYDQAAAMEAWQAEHGGGQVPDLPAEPTLLERVHAPPTHLETLRDAGDLITLLRGCLRRLREKQSGSDLVWNEALIAEADALLAGPILPIPLRPGEQLLPAEGAAYHVGVDLSSGPDFCAEGLYEAARAALSREGGLRPEDAPPWLLEAMLAASAVAGTRVSGTHAEVLRRAGVRLRRVEPAEEGLPAEWVVEGQMGAWTGPRPEEWAEGGGLVLRQPVPAARWPFGPPEEHGPGCGLRSGGLFCDCCQSAAECDCHKR